MSTNLNQNRVKKFLSLAISFAILLPTSACYSPVFDNPSKKTLPEEQTALEKKQQDSFLGKNEAEIRYEKLKQEFKNSDLIDRKAGLSRQDYHDSFYKTNIPPISNETNIIMPDISDMIINPKNPIIADGKLITLAVTENVPIKDVLIELARRAGVDMEIDPSISGGIILSATDKPFADVIERICRLAGLRYNIDGDVLKIERDSRRIKNYRMSFLNMIRTSTSEVTTASELGSGSSEGGGTTSGSTSTLTTTSEEGDIWTTITSGISNILTQYAASAEGATPAATSTTQLDQGILSINRHAGVISIMATDKQHGIIKQYLDYVHMSQTSQVLIEAKVLEVSLNDEYRSGIDWNFLNSNLTDLTVSNSFNDLGNLGDKASQVFSIGVLPTELLGLDNTSLDASIQLVEEFGTSKTLSSPRINAMNNQHAVLTFAENFVYITLDVSEETDADSGNTELTITPEVNTVPIGVILNLQPSIDLESQEIIMSIRPTLTRVTGTVGDPSVAILAANAGIDLNSDIPIVDVREIDSVLRLRSGQVMVIGGLMEEVQNNTDRGLPGLSKIPFFGNAFKSVQKTSQIVETVIFIKATIVPGRGVSVEDRDFYRKFTNERNSLTF